MIQYRIKSKFLSAITETVHKLTFTEDNVTATPPVMDDEGNFVSDVDSEKELNITGVDVEKKDPEQEKSELVAQAAEKLKNAIDIAAELDDIINSIRNVDNKLNVSNVWEINDEQNDVYLQSKDAHIFQQNGNILLSHDGKIEIFQTVPELHGWLKQNGYPMPPAVEIHESGEKAKDELKEDEEDGTGFYVFDKDDNVVKGPFKTSKEAEKWIDSLDSEESKWYLIDYIRG